MGRNAQQRGRGMLVAVLVAIAGFASAVPGDAAQAPSIVGGSEVAHDWPAMAQLYWGDRFECGGTLVAASWVLTAGHCVTADFTGQVRAPGDLGVRLGSSTMGDGTFHAVTRVVRHPKYDDGTAAYDAALLELDEPAVQPPLPVVGSADADRKSVV